MKQGRKGLLWISLGLFAAFVLWTVLISAVDVRPVGPEGSSVGLATLNVWVHELTGVHMALYTVTDGLGLAPIAVALGFAVLGLCQWIMRRHILRVDYGVLAMGVFYVAVVAVFCLFEVLVINYRPVLIEGVLEASYPSSTTMLCTTVIPSALLYLWPRMKGTGLRVTVAAVMIAFAAFMVIARLLSGVHWVTDIVGGGLISGALVTLYAFATRGRV